MTHRTLACVFMAAVAAAGLAGCQTRATLEEFAAARPDAATQSYKSGMAIFRNDNRGQQTIVLALQPTNAVPKPIVPVGHDVLVPDEPMKYRAYVLLVVSKDGGTFQIGQKTAGGQVRATYYVHDAFGKLRVISDQYGQITTKVWPTMGGFDQNEWWITGSFDLLMATDIKLTGTFVARPAPTLVDKFLRERKL